MITLTELNSARTFNYTVIFILLVIFTGSIASIKFIYGDSKKDEDKESTDETINEETTEKLQDYKSVQMRLNMALRIIHNEYL